MILVTFKKYVSIYVQLSQNKMNTATYTLVFITLSWQSELLSRIEVTNYVRSDIGESTLGRHRLKLWPNIFCTQTSSLYVQAKEFRKYEIYKRICLIVTHRSTWFTGVTLFALFAPFSRWAGGTWRTCNNEKRDIETCIFNIVLYYEC